MLALKGSLSPKKKSEKRWMYCTTIHSPYFCSSVSIFFLLKKPIPIKETIIYARYLKKLSQVT